jgi:hypothetical protein
MGRLAQNIIDARIPAGTGRAIMFHHAGIKPQGDVLLGLAQTRALDRPDIVTFHQVPFQGSSQTSFQKFSHSDLEPANRGVRHSVGAGDIHQGLAGFATLQGFFPLARGVNFGGRPM